MTFRPYTAIVLPSRVNTELRGAELDIVRVQINRISFVSIRLHSRLEVAMSAYRSLGWSSGLLSERVGFSQPASGSPLAIFTISNPCSEDNSMSRIEIAHTPFGEGYQYPLLNVDAKVVPSETFQTRNSCVPLAMSFRPSCEKVMVGGSLFPVHCFRNRIRSEESS